MARNRNTNQAPLLDPYENEINDLRGTIKALGSVSTEIGKEIEKQNSLLDQLNDDFERGKIQVQKLLKKINDIFNASGLSPMTLTIIFIFGVLVFLWLYWKWTA